MPRIVDETHIVYKDRRFAVTFPPGSRPRVRERVLTNPGHPFLERWKNIPRYSNTSRYTPMYEEIIKLAIDKKATAEANKK